MTGEGTVEQVLAGERRWCVLHEECQNRLFTLAEQGHRVDHVITDPPYESEAHNSGRRCRGRVLPGGKRELVKAEIDFEPIDADTRRVVGEGIAAIARRLSLIFCQIEGAMAWREAVEASGVANYRRTCIWVKPDGQPQLSGDRPGMGYESIVTSHRKGRSSWNGGGKLGVFSFNKADTHVSTARGEKNPHPTMKPLPLMLELLSLFTDPGDVVLDPFGGSGTTGVAALRLGRRVILIERESQYAKLCRERLIAESRDQTYAQLRSGQEPLPWA